MNGVKIRIVKPIWLVKTRSNKGAVMIAQTKPERISAAPYTKRLLFTRLNCKLIRTKNPEVLSE
jgi:hypothetical protein